MRRLIITGGGGFVAGGIIHQAPSEWELHVLSAKEPQTRRSGLIWHTLDWNDPGAARTIIAGVAPQAVVHAAAIGNIDFCEQHPDRAHLANVEWTAAVAAAAAAQGCRLLYLSTDTVFDGVLQAAAAARGGYVEEDPPSPINEYARTKAAGERLVAKSANHVIVRAALVMGFGLLGAGNSFLERTVAMLRDQQTIYVPPEEIRTPIDVVTLSRALLELCAGNFRGTIHLAGNERLDRISLTRRLATRLGFSAQLIVPRAPDQIAGRAPRPRDVSLCNHLARTLLKTPMRDFDSALELVVNSSPARST
jgi:dTDP-4-dehydrorhamnose reductase